MAAGCGGGGCSVVTLQKQYYISLFNDQDLVLLFGHLCNTPKHPIKWEDPPTHAIAWITKHKLTAGYTCIQVHYMCGTTKLRVEG